MSEPNLTVVFAVFPGVTQLDFTAPHQVFSMLPGTEVIVASTEGGTLTGSGLTFAGLRRLADIPACDVICVPGGYGATDIAAQVAQHAFGALKSPIKMVTPPHTPVPFAPELEDLYVPNAAKIEAATAEAVRYAA